MKRPIKTDDLAKLTVADAAAGWKLQSENLNHRHPAYPYVFHAQYNANVKNYLPLALEILRSRNEESGNGNGEGSPACEASQMMLMAIFDHGIDEIANAARASFLHRRFGVDLEKALTLTTAELGIERNAAKAANGVAEAVRRMIRFYMIWLTTCSSVLIESKWPSTPRNLRRGKASFLMGRIRREMIARGIFDPQEATPKMIVDALRIYTEKVFSTNDARHWNCSLRDLRTAVAAGYYPGMTESLLSELVEMRPNPRNPERTLKEADLVKLWPEYFPSKTDDAEHLDPERGIPGFFNKELGSHAPGNPAGKPCPPKRQLHRRAHTNRFRAVRRYLIRIQAKTGIHDNRLVLRDAFAPDNIKEWLNQEIKEKGKVMHSHRDDYMHVLMVSIHYFNHDVGEQVTWIKENIQFIDTWESTRGEQALRKGTPQTLMEQAEAMGLYAESVRPLSCKKPGIAADHVGAGQYLIRKAAQVDCWLRILTGLRPAAVDALEVADAPDRGGASPKIWRATDGYYVVFIPLRWMKQHLSKIWGKNRADVDSNSSAHEVKGFEFEIRRAEAVTAIDDYLNHGWCHAKAVTENRTRALFLNTKGEPFKLDQFGKAIGSLRSEVYHFMQKRHGRETERHDRYQTRHIMSTFIENHLPGKSLKTTYLTHSSDFGSDSLYGKTNMTLLRETIDEVLDGKPNRLQQQELREKERDERLLELTKQVAQLTAALTEKVKS